MLNFIRALFGRLPLAQRIEIDLHEAISELEECEHYKNMLTARINRLSTALVQAKPQDPVHSIINKESAQ